MLRSLHYLFIMLRLNANVFSWFGRSVWVSVTLLSPTNSFLLLSLFNQAKLAFFLFSNNALSTRCALCLECSLVLAQLSSLRKIFQALIHIILITSLFSSHPSTHFYLKLSFLVANLFIFYLLLLGWIQPIRQRSFWLIHCYIYTQCLKHIFWG